MTMQTAGYKKPLPRVTQVSRPYWEATKRHELVLPKCNDCGHVWYPPASEICPRCLSDRFEWTKMSGKGKVWSWIVMYQRYFAGFAEELPYNVAFIELAEGPRMMSSIVNCAPDAIQCNMPVEVVFDDVTDEIALPKFQPEQG